jgi:hypothetical protein
MRVYLDDALIENARPTLAGGVTAAAAIAQSRGRIIIQVMADGAPLADEKLADLPDSSDGVAELRLTSADTRSIVRVALGDAAELLEGHIATHKQTALLFQQGDVQGGFADLDRVVEVWRVARETLEKCAAALGLDGDSLARTALQVHRDFAEAANAVSSLSVKLNELKSGIERQDWSAVADLLEFDLPEQAQLWSAMLRAVADHVAKLDVS